MMKYSKEQLIALSGDIRRSKGDLDTQNDDLMVYANKLAESWNNDEVAENDSAYGAYLVKQREWETAERELLAVLERIAAVVEDGAINMSDTDKRNAGAWYGM